MTNSVAAKCSTVNSEFFVSILFSRIVLKDMFAMLKIHNWNMNYLLQSDIAMSQGFYFQETSHMKFRENKTLAKISEIKVSHQALYN